MSKKLLIAVVVAVALLTAGYWYWKSVPKALTPEQEALKNAEESVRVITESATRGVLPSLNVPSNSLGDVPDVNPVTKINPFAGIKTNPFK